MQIYVLTLQQTHYILIMSKIQFLFILFAAMYCCCVTAQTRPIVIQNGGSTNDHLEQFIPADQPDVYYDIVAQTLIIDGGGEVTYYDVEIASVTTTLTVISTQVNGYYDTIDISTLPQDEYVITIYSPEDHTYEGFFEI